MSKASRDRTPLYKMFAKEGFERGAEIGVFKGINAERMMRHIPDVFLYLIDPWDDLLAYKETVERMRPYPKRALVIQKTSLHGALSIPDNYLDFAYIDGDHSYDAVMLDIILWGRRVRPGGILAGHDYIRTRKHGVKRAVNDYTQYHNIDLHVLNKNWYWRVGGEQ